MTRTHTVSFLEHAYQSAPWDDWIPRDPIWHVRRFQDPRDQEIAGLIAASLAYGRVGSIMPSVDRVVSAMDNRPYHFVTQYDVRKEAERFSRCTHRFHTPDAIVATLTAVQGAVDRHGSLRELFLAGYRPKERTTCPALCRFVDVLRRFTERVQGEWMDCKPLYGWRHFLATPEDGSACKRLNLYLRWMVRTGVPDVGAWPEVQPARLLVPVDVHVAAIARRLGWTRRASADLRMAEEITAVLRRVDPADPTRFDFVLSHMGMDGLVS